MRVRLSENLLSSAVTGITGAGTMSVSPQRHAGTGKAGLRLQLGTNATPFPPHSFLPPSPKELFSHTENLRLLSLALRDCVKEGGQATSDHRVISEREFVDATLDSGVIEHVVAALLAQPCTLPA